MELIDKASVIAAIGKVTREITKESLFWTVRTATAKEMESRILAELGAVKVIEPREDPATATDSGFDAFWVAYDKKVERKRTEALWSRLSKRDREAAMAYLPAYKAAQPDKRYRKNPATFLRNRSWEDEIIDQSNHTHHGNTLPSSAAVMAEQRKTEVQELSRIATAGAAALAGLVGGSEDE